MSESQLVEYKESWCDEYLYRRIENAIIEER